jgi:hypothetical protein
LLREDFFGKIKSHPRKTYETVDFVKEISVSLPLQIRKE